MSSMSIIQQSEIPGAPSSAVVRNYSIAAIAELELDFRAALPQELPFAVGVAIQLAPVGSTIFTLALATQDQVFCLPFQQTLSQSHRKALRKLLNLQYLTGFELPYTITLLARALGSDVSGYDLSTLKVGDIATPGDFLHCKKVSVTARTINEMWDGGVLGKSDVDSTGTPEPDYALRAWFTAIAAKMAIEDLPLGKQLSTRFIDSHMLQTYADLAARAIRRDFMKPRIQENDFSEVKTKRDGSMTVHNARFKTRIRSSRQTHLEVYLKNGDVVDAKIQGAKGRQSTARTEKKLKGDIARIRVIGCEERSNSELAQYYFLLSSLTDTRPTPSFITSIWSPGRAQGIERRDEGIHSLHDHAQILEKLNNSQREIVGAMLSPAPHDSLVIAHGPPGTGKTTTIAAAAAIWVSRRLPCWIIAHSNVGVKNIAEKLFKKDVDFRLIISQEFYFEWHEKLYEEIEAKLIRSDDLPDSKGGVLKTFGGATVVLCTLSMLSNPRLVDCGLYDILPVKSLVIDEASQIDVFEFMHLFHKFLKELTKVCFFGDPKQLPPYGSKEAGLETIFDVKHLKKKSSFLDTQYRLPVPLGSFISENVYNGKLRSQHEIADYSCIAFIDVWKGEERKQGSSYLNMEEVHMVVRIARRYHHHRLNFCIITFYDPQRAAIIKALQNADLPSEFVYNVDSFQGNEADYVILSSVRTKLPGFLNSHPRMNVALTRCRKGMVVVTNKGFLQHAGKGTLLGKLCRSWSQHRGAACWTDWKAMLNNSVGLPGLPLLSPPSASSRSQRQQQQLSFPTSIAEQSRSTAIHSSTRHTKMPPHDPPPPSKPQTRTRTRTQPRTHQGSSRPVLTWATVQAGLGTQTVGAQRQSLDAFPSLQVLATALDQPSRRRKPKGHKAK